MINESVSALRAVSSRLLQGLSQHFLLMTWIGLQNKPITGDGRVSDYVDDKMRI